MIAIKVYRVAHMMHYCLAGVYQIWHREMDGFLVVSQRGAAILRTSFMFMRQFD